MAIMRNRGNDPFAKIGADMAAENVRLEEAYSALGKAYFASHENDAEEALAPQVAAVEASVKKVEIYKELLVRMRGVKVCPNCGNEVTAQSSFCNICGTKIPDPEPLCDGEHVYCNVCGAPMPLGQQFCSSCGSSLPETVSPDAPAAPEAPDAAPVEEAPAPEAPIEEAPAEPALQICPVCGKELSLDMKFCTGCGHNLSNPAPAANVCPACGATLAPEQVFCTSCGVRVK